MTYAATRDELPKPSKGIGTSDKLRRGRKIIGAILAVVMGTTFPFSQAAALPLFQIRSILQ